MFAFYGEALHPNKPVKIGIVYLELLNFKSPWNFEYFQVFHIITAYNKADSRFYMMYPAVTNCSRVDM